MSKRRKLADLADNVADMNGHVARDFDPENSDFSEVNGTDSSDEKSIVGEERGREHYQPVGESKLRKRLVPTLGPAYEGSRISRKDALREEYDEDEDIEDQLLASGDHSSSDEDERMNLVDSSENEAKLKNDTANVDEQLDDLYSSGESVSGYSDGGFGSNGSVSSQSQDSSRSSVTDYANDVSDDDISSESAEKNDDENEENDEDVLKSRAAVRQILKDEQKIVAANVSRAVRADVEKGRAVKKQKATFDSLLNVRLKMQKAVIASNTLQIIKNENSPQKARPADGTVNARPKNNDDKTMNGNSETHDNAVLDAAEEAAIKLWKSLTTLRDTLIQAGNNSQKRKRESSSPTQIHNFSAGTSAQNLWQYMQDQEKSSTQSRHAILNKWSTRLRSTNPTSLSGNKNSSGGSINNPHRLNPNSSLNPRRQSQTSLSDLLTADLAPNSTSYNRLLARAHTVRSCAPAHTARGQASSQDIYDDTDFYGALLQTFLEQRSQYSNAMGREGGGGEIPAMGNGANSAADLATDRPLFFTPRWEAAKAAKVKKVVDTRASKGRKLKYTVHEKLQNFMAPENRCSWDERQTDELFGSLFGKRFMLDEDESMDGDRDGVEDDDVDVDDNDQNHKVEEQEAGLLLYGR